MAAQQENTSLTPQPPVWMVDTRHDVSMDFMLFMPNSHPTICKSMQKVSHQNRWCFFSPPLWSESQCCYSPSTSEMLFCIPLFELLLPFCQLELVWPLLIFTFWPTELLLLCVWKLEVTSFEIFKPPCCSTSNNSSKSPGHISSQFGCLVNLNSWPFFIEWLWCNWLIRYLNESYTMQDFI